MGSIRRWLSKPAFAAIVGVCWAASGCVEPETEEKPDPPRMDQMLQAYDAPSADLNPETMGQLIVTMLEYLEVITGAQGFGFLFEDVIGALDEEEEGAETGLIGLREAGFEVREQPASLSGDGFARITRSCNGWDGATSPNPSDGSIELIVGFTQSQVDSVAWGGFSSCRYTVEGQQLLLNGGLRIWLGNNLVFSSLEQAGQEPILVAMDGLVEFNGENGTVSLSALDFRIIPDGGSYEIRLPTADGDVVFFTEGDATKFRAANGVWTCDFEAVTCVNDSDPSISFTW